MGWTVTESRQDSAPEIEVEPDGSYCMQWPGVEVWMSSAGMAETFDRIRQAIAAEVSDQSASANVTMAAAASVE